VAARFPGRALANDLTARFAGREDAAAADPEVRAAFVEAVRSRDFSVAHVYAGQSVGMLARARPAAEVIRELGAVAEAILRERFAELT
jgi:NAD(P)H-dependent flavin oxidoreductase YrpB (nitropropane dioxygenase family)